MAAPTALVRLKTVRWEMKLIKETYNPDQIRVVDDITGVDRRWVFDWHDAVLAHDAIIPFECLSRVNLVDVPLLKALKNMGCQKIYFGAESGSQKVLNAMKKGSKVEQIYRAAEACRQVGIEFLFLHDGRLSGRRVGRHRGISKVAD